VTLKLAASCVYGVAAGACYDSLGLSAEEVQGLAGLKEGCGDDMDTITVQRPAPATANGLSTPSADAAAAPVVGSTARANNSSGSEGAGGGAGAAGQQQQQLVEVQLPLGSVRASLGWASTFEDAYALVQFLKGYLG
jgi:hypothetical protein